MNPNDVEFLRKMYPVGTKIKLLKMDDIQAPPIGTIGTVRFVDDWGQLQMTWSTGGGLALIPGIDLFEIVQ